MSYLSRISRSKDEKEKANLERAAKQAKQQLDVDILSTEQKVEELTAKVEEAKGQVPFNANTIITLQRTLANAEEDLDNLQTLKAEEFGE